MFCYEGKGVGFNKRFTDYKLDGEHVEAIVAQTEFCERLKRYFLYKLLIEDVTSAEETLRLTDELIALCDKMIKTNGSTRRD